MKQSSVLLVGIRFYPSTKMTAQKRPDFYDLYVPDEKPLAAAMARVTHMGIGAHQDDLEIFAYHGIAACYRKTDRWFAGVTVTDGGGSARTGPFASFSDEEMKAVRLKEQREAARIGEYALQAQLGFPSSAVKDKEDSAELVDQLEFLLRHCRPDTLYIHNPADKHDTHIATLARCIEALRRLMPEERPKRVYGCEVWRDLDWVADELKIALPVDAFPGLAAKLITVFESQVAGGKDYVQATLGRRRANATFFDPRTIDQATAYTFALDLAPIVERSDLSLHDFTIELVDAFREDVRKRIQRFAT